jgi:hypothetical protein
VLAKGPFLSGLRHKNEKLLFCRNTLKGSSVLYTDEDGSDTGSCSVDCGTLPFLLNLKSSAGLEQQHPELAQLHGHLQPYLGHGPFKRWKDVLNGMDKCRDAFISSRLRALLVRQGVE